MGTVNVALPFLPAEAILRRTSVKATDGEIYFRAVLPLKIADFKIPAPSLFGLPVKNDVPVDVDRVWKKGRRRLLGGGSPNG